MQVQKEDTNTVFWKRLIQEEGRHPNITFDFCRFVDEEEDDDDKYKQYSGNDGFGDFAVSLNFIPPLCSMMTIRRILTFLSLNRKTSRQKTKKKMLLRRAKRSINKSSGYWQNAPVSLKKKERMIMRMHNSRATKRKALKDVTNAQVTSSKVISRINDMQKHLKSLVEADASPERVPPWSIYKTLTITELGECNSAESPLHEPAEWKKLLTQTSFPGRTLLP